MYPPGQFSLWNRPSVRMAWLGVMPEGAAADGDGDPGYAHLAVSDPSADATSTQTWAAIEDSGGWRTAQPGRRAAAQSDHGAYPGARAAGPAPEPGLATRAGDVVPPLPAGRPDGDARPPSDSPGAPDPGGRARRPGGRGRPAEAGGRGGARTARSAASRAGAGAAASRARTASGPAGRSNKLLVALLGAPVAVVVVIVTVYVAMHSGSPIGARTTTLATPRSAASPGPALGPWRHIGARADDPRPLTLAELFPAQFSTAGIAGKRTAEKAGAKCTRDVVGGKLRSAVRKASCTQAMRASYLSSDRKVMATIGVLNLLSAADAKTVGKASGASEFISQLPGPRGPTKNLTQGTGLEEAVVKGHYLILIWAEFANLKTPSGKLQRAELEQFSSALLIGTVNTSLSSRMVTGQPVAAP